MSHKLGSRVVAEGVEDEKQKEYLIQNDCDIIQGYLFSKSVPMETALQMLNSK